MTPFQARIPSSETSQYPATFLSAIPENNDDLSNEITRLAGHINAANYRFLKLLAALVERGAWAGYGIKSPAHWQPEARNKRQETSSSKDAAINIR